jgi:hypothetical protein
MELSTPTKAMVSKKSMSNSLSSIMNPVGESLNREDRKMAAGTAVLIQLD